jgi:hypothetical protein
MPKAMNATRAASTSHCVSVGALPLLRGMEDAEDHKLVAGDAIDDDVGQPRDDELAASARAQTTEVRKAFKLFYCLNDAPAYELRGTFSISRDIGADAGQVVAALAQPPQPYAPS